LFKALEEYYYFISNGKINLISSSTKEIANYFSKKRIIQNELLSKKTVEDQQIGGLLLSSVSYLNDQRVLSGICKVMEIQCITVLQPVLPLRNKPVGIIEEKNFLKFENDGTLSLVRRFYNEVLLRIFDLENEYYKVLDISDLMNKKNYINLPFFYDFGHTGYFSGEILGEEIGFFLKSIVEN